MAIFLTSFYLSFFVTFSPKYKKVLKHNLLQALKGLRRCLKYMQIELWRRFWHLLGWQQFGYFLSKLVECFYNHLVTLFDHQSILMAEAVLSVSFKVAGDKGISETNLKLKIPCSKWCHRPMHAPHRLMRAPHRLMHACTACIAQWHHRPMHAVTA